MYTFFFNSELLPHCKNLTLFNIYFSQVLIAYNRLIDNEKLNIEKGIITEKMPTELSLGEFSLAEAIDSLKEPTLRRIAYAYFIKHPIENFCSIQEELLEQNYYFFLDAEKSIKVLYLAQIAHQKGLLFTVAISDFLKRNQLKLVNENHSLFINNFYCEEKNSESKCNIDFIEAYLQNELFSNSNLLEKIKILINAQFSSKFEKEFESLSDDEKKSIFTLFERAKAIGLLSSVKYDDKIIKDVTPSNTKDGIKVYELRVYAPIALRVYFSVNSEKIFIASLEKKSNPNQNKDIKDAADILVKMIRESH